MKNLILFYLLFFILTFASGQVKYNKPGALKLPLTGSNIAYKATIVLDSSYSKEQLFDNGIQWYKRNFQSADNTLNINDADAGKLSGTGIIHAHKQGEDITPQDIFFTVTIVAVKGSYLYQFDSLYSFENRTRFYYSDMYSEELYTPTKPKWTKQYRQSMLYYMNNRMIEVINKLRADMIKK